MRTFPVPIPNDQKTLPRVAGVLAALLALVLGGVAEAATLRVHYDTGYGNRIAVRGSKSPLSWTVGQNATWTTGNIWVYSWSDSIGDVDVKPLVNDATWSVGANYRVKAGATVDVYPYFNQQNKGTLRTVTGFYSPQLGNSRTLILYLPPSYSENPLKRYPVLYMHDGQNLFDAATSFGGVEWQVDENANGLIAGGTMDEVIVVGIYNAGANRLYEYTPCCDASYGGGGVNSYERFLIDTVKPYVDANYRTLPGKDTTALMGSSLGGLASFYIVRRNPSVFGKAGCMSSSFWWNNQALPQEVEVATGKVPARFYIDAGTSSDGLTETTRMRDALVADGYVQGGDLYYYVAQGGSHNEASWSARLYIPLQYLFPWQSTAY
ncbi:MAG TPA: alpha/beta hydrolase-fold protein [Polyangia bacterium]|jgi:predicted alpha/beta superfamily hydrolase|nr:alpha/beta hydrolase-fold protein [Polyangia bacterium]